MRNVLALVVAGMALAGSWRMQAQGAPSLEERYRQIPDAARSAATWSGSARVLITWAAPYTKDNAEWMLARFREWGWEARIETYDVLFPTPKERLLEMTAPTQIQGNARRTGGCRGPNFGPEGRAASDVQHLLHRRRCDRTAGLRELRPPRRLRRTGRARHLCPRRHRHCAVRRVFSRDEAENRRRAWRDRLPDLLRSQRRRVLR